MPKKRVLETLDQLQAELAGMEKVDKSTRAALQQVTDAIQRQLGAAGDESGDVSLEDDTAVGQLHDFMLGVEADHPKLTRALNQVAAALANLGI